MNHLNYNLKEYNIYPNILLKIFLKTNAKKRKIVEDKKN
jgi:hypothetical protein